MAHQFTDNLALTADYVHWRSQNEWIRVDSNLAYDPATGYNLLPAQTGRPDPRFTSILTFVQHDQEPDGSLIDPLHGDYDGLQVGLRRRFNNNYQITASYTLSRTHDMTTGPFYRPSNMFDVANEYAPSEADQRHRLVLNGLVEIPYGFRVSGLYFFGSGQHYESIVGGDPFGNGTTRNRYLSSANANAAKLGYTPGSVVPRNSIVGDPIHRVDLRIANAIPVGEQVRIEPMLEIFNLFNHDNFGGYNRTVTSSRFAQPTRNSNVAYDPRVVQLGIRLSF